MTVGVDLLSLVLQGTTMSSLMRRLGMVEEQIGNAGLGALGNAIERRRQRAQERLSALHLASGELRRDEGVRAVRRLPILERNTLGKAVADGDVRSSVANALAANVDARMVRLDAGAESETLVVPADDLAVSDNAAPERHATT